MENTIFIDFVEEEQLIYNNHKFTTLYTKKELIEILKKIRITLNTYEKKGITDEFVSEYNNESLKKSSQ